MGLKPFAHHLRATGADSGRALRHPGPLASALSTPPGPRKSDGLRTVHLGSREDGEGTEAGVQASAAHRKGTRDAERL